MGFDIDKKNILNKDDKSKKGSIDSHILEFVNKINQLKDYYTTSSCSGRIMLIKRADNGKKNEAEWLFVSHETIKFSDLKDALLNLPEEDVWFREESMILHVCCRTIEDAEKMLGFASEAGFKRAGIAAAKKKIMVEIMGTEFIDTIIAKDGKLLVDEDYIKVLIEYANKKLAKGHERINNFEKIIEKIK